MLDLVLSPSEQAAVLSNPRSILLLMDWHDYQQTCAEASDMDCTGNRDRYEELKALGRSIIEKEGAEIFDEEVLRGFGVPVPAVVSAPASDAEKPEQQVYKVDDQDLQELLNHVSFLQFAADTNLFLNQDDAMGMMLALKKVQERLKRAEPIAGVDSSPVKATTDAPEVDVADQCWAASIRDQHANPAAGYAVGRVLTGVDSSPVKATTDARTQASAERVAFLRATGFYGCRTKDGT